jgi:hypothetical protein
MAGGHDSLEGEFSSLRHPREKAAFARELSGFPCADAPFCRGPACSRRAAMRIGGLVRGFSTSVISSSC